ncbi:MAG TPA: glycosyltransferase family 4 protein [Polyangiaceae bacterium]|nr:glycosyltransferase family 4 protein [Polyangiaceae bacterium]
MSIAVVAQRFPPEPGGLARASERIADLAVQRGEQVHVITFSRKVAPGARTTREQGRYLLHAIGELADEERALRALVDHGAAVVEDNALDLVHGIYGGFAATLIADFTARPSVVSLRGNDFDRGLFRAELPRLEHAMRRATVVTAVTRQMAERAGRVFGREVRYVPNAVDAEAFRRETPDNSLRASLGLGEAQVIGFAGELREKKGMRFLLPAFAAVARRRNVHLLLIGGLREEAQAAMEVFRRAEPGAFERVHVLPYERSAQRLSGLYALCDVMVFASLFEGMPNAVLEAMAAECAILATDVGGHRELIEHGASGALVSLNDLDRLPEAIEEMLDLPAERRRELGAVARRRVMDQHSLERESVAWGEIYSAARR